MSLAIAGVEEPEGPVCLEDGSFLIVEMSDRRHAVVHVGTDGRKRDVAVTAGRPNGLAIDGDGLVWIAEATEGALLAVTMDGVERCKVAGDADGRFLWPNDIALAPDGMLYMTDSGIIDRDFIDGLDIRADYMTAPYDGRLYEIDPRRGVVSRTLDRGLRFTNGIAFGPDGLLYVAETLSGDIFVYDRTATSPARRLFGNCLAPDDSTDFKGPDGIKFGADGRLYCTIYGQGVVAVLDREGRLVERLPTQGRKPTNIAFRRNGREALVTEVSGSAVEIMAMPTEGLALFYPKGLRP
ncbi:SMP-30/gluconolactonase/LRE family protein [Lichenicoccus roseus]|uniref:SMP-30/gluconolactonase/LRE family protein n=1 Tax=Lichenicoccus roseus TaxID=2683649 RepID=A0A5R9JAV2_9PROT|nr:SMP-30/gluconolactonase/LRE family protein [Lichenicoccus roseus]TLU71348.1 SMP-30/gluconolactonase/LRE family protein [Lichenicoccus roseus]